MNSETSQAIAPGITGIDGTVHRVAVKAHEAVDKLEQTVGAGTERPTRAILRAPAPSVPPVSSIRPLQAPRAAAAH